MRPTREQEDALVDLVDVILEEGVVLQADVIISVAEVPLVGLKLRAALAGMATMTEYGLFEEWDERIRGEASNDRREATLGHERSPGVGHRPTPRTGNDG
ncbi:gas vesicle protein GvpM [Halobium salinum]|uniref:Gas vesicle protein GvpM n=1 Tax=Halobium salinum TaxID=1364940 RepID=A0ABD5PHC2_9EURY|nr:gas vesicle protein [Halobium salinum]